MYIVYGTETVSSSIYTEFSSKKQYIPSRTINKNVFPFVLIFISQYGQKHASKKGKNYIYKQSLYGYSCYSAIKNLIRPSN